MRANSQPDLRHHHHQQQGPLKLRPEESIMHMSSASGPSPAAPAPPFSRFALTSWMEEGGGGGGGRSHSRSSSSRSRSYYHARDRGSSTTELADWVNSSGSGGGGGGGGGGGITKTTEVSQSQHRLDSLPRLDAALLSKGPEVSDRPTQSVSGTRAARRVLGFFAGRFVG